MLIQDNASYHKDKDVWSWFKSNRHWLEVHQLPAYCPELNPAERLWQHTRKTGTHNRYFATRMELETTLHRVFGEMQHHPRSSARTCFLFVDRHVPLITRGCIALFIRGSSI